jgi:hypothetical protein
VSGRAARMIAAAYPEALCSESVTSLHRYYGLMCQSICLFTTSLPHSWQSLCRLDHPRLVNGPSRRYPASLSLDASSPTPVALKVLLLVSSPQTSALPKFTVGRRLTLFRTATSARGRISGLQTFLYVKASSFACHPDRSYRCVLNGSCPQLWRQVNLFAILIAILVPLFSLSCLSEPPVPQGSCGFYIRAEYGSLPPHTSDMLVARIEQLTTGGLSPPQTRSLSAAP